MENFRITEEAVILAEKLWNYHRLNHPLKKSGCILVLGSHDTRVAERGAELFLAGWAPILIFSGGLGNLTRDKWTRAEADIFADIAAEMGVPESAVLVENRSTNTGENIVFTMKLLKDKGLAPASFMLVQKPYMERRSYATFKKHLPGTDVTVTSPGIPFREYPNDEIPLDKVINILTGDLQRIIEYPEKGFQIYQHVPDDVLAAYRRLLEMGFTGHLAE